jgi:hypothetical protein
LLGSEKQAGLWSACFLCAVSDGPARTSGIPPPVALNFGDCFAYACERYANLPLLYKGDDFPQSDIKAA